MKFQIDAEFHEEKIGTMFGKAKGYHDTPKAFPDIFILLSSWTQKSDFFQPMDSLAREYHAREYQG